MVGVAVRLAASAPSGEDVLDARWAMVSRPTGSAALPDPPDARATIVVPDVAGSYVVSFGITTRDGRTASCRIAIEAVSQLDRLHLAVAGANSAFD